MPFGGILPAGYPALEQPVTNYSNTYGSGNRVGSVTITANGVNLTNGVLSNLINGQTGTSTPQSVTEDGGAISIGTYYRWQFPSKVYIDALRMIHTVVSINYGLWQIRGSNDGSSWTVIDGYNWSNGGTGICDQPITNPYYDGFFYYQMIKIASGDSFSTSWFFEQEFKIAPGAV